MFFFITDKKCTRLDYMCDTMGCFIKKQDLTNILRAPRFTTGFLVGSMSIYYDLSGKYVTFEKAIASCCLYTFYYYYYLLVFVVVGFF